MIPRPPHHPEITVALEEHVATGNGVPFSPRTVYWVRELTPNLRERRTTTYSRTVALRVYAEAVTRTDRMLRDIWKGIPVEQITDHRHPSIDNVSFVVTLS